MIAQKLVLELLRKNVKISTMESCTGGGFADAITNIPRSSEVFEFGAVTYSNEFKIKFGVASETIDKYSVYSEEVAMKMAKAIAEFADTDYGVGITGKLKCADINNEFNSDDVVYISVYDRQNDMFMSEEVTVLFDTRRDNKAYVIKYACELCLKMMKISEI